MFNFPFAWLTVMFVAIIVGPAVAFCGFGQKVAIYLGQGQALNNCRRMAFAAFHQSNNPRIHKQLPWQSHSLP